MDPDPDPFIWPDPDPFQTIRIRVAPGPEVKFVRNCSFSSKILTNAKLKMPKFLLNVQGFEYSRRFLIDKGNPQNFSFQKKAKKFRNFDFFCQDSARIRIKMKRIHNTAKNHVQNYSILYSIFFILTKSNIKPKFGQYCSAPNQCCGSGSGRIRVLWPDPTAPKEDLERP